MSAAEAAPAKAMKKTASKRQSAIGMVRPPFGRRTCPHCRPPPTPKLCRFNDGVLKARPMLACGLETLGGADDEISRRVGRGARPLDRRWVGIAGSGASHAAAETHAFRTGRSESRLARCTEERVLGGLGAGPKSRARCAGLAR